MYIRNFMLGSTAMTRVFAPETGEGTSEAQVKPDVAAGAGDEAGDATTGQDDTAGAAAAGAEGADGDAEGADSAGEGEGDPPPAQSAADWRDKEISRKHRQLQEQKRRLEAIEQENRDLRALAERAAGGRAAAPAAGEAEPAARAAAPAALGPDAIRAEAEKIVAQDRFIEDSNQTHQAGLKAYGKNWEPACERLKVLGGVDMPVMMQILASDNPAKVLYELGSNPDNYHRVMELPEAKRLSEIVKLGLSGPRKKTVSSAPDPVDQLSARPAGGVGKVDIYDDKVEDDKWFAERAKQKKARWEAKQGGLA